MSRQATQRHRMALLALLAAAGSRGLSRDKVIGYLWPDSDTQRARNALNVSVYVLRKALGDAALQTQGDELRLDSGVVSADTVLLDAAHAEGDHATVVALHRGPFLDGFFLPDASEFEAWAERERQRLGAAYADALEQLAAAARARGDHAGAVSWWKRRAVHDPYDSRVALELVRSLDAAGNPAGALQHAGVHERLIHEEFDLELPAEVTALVASIRARVSREAVTGEARGSTPEPRGLESGADETVAIPHQLTEARIEAAAGEARSEAAAAETRPRTQLRQRLALRIASAALLVVVLAFGARYLVGSGRGVSVPAEPVLAVLPLTNQSVDPADALLADGMTEALISMLARATGLRVLGRTSVFAFREPHADLQQIADSLGASHVIEGALQKVGARLRVHIRLVDAREGATLWSQTYDRQLEDVFSVQEDIARSVSNELGTRLGRGAVSPMAPRHTENVAAYELYLRASDPVLLRSDSGARAGLEYARQALALDSGYAPAYAALARLHLRVTGRSAQSAGPTAPALDSAEAAARRALALEEGLAEGHSSLGLVALNRRDYAAAESYLKRAIELDPANARNHEWLSGLYLWTGRHSDALAETRIAVDIDPLSASAHAELARALAQIGRCDAALRELDRLRALNPPLLRAAPLRAQCYAQQERWREAVAALGEVDDSDAFSKAQVGYLLARAGAREEAEAIRAQLLDSYHRNRYGAYNVATVTAGLGDLDDAFLWLERAADEGSLTFTNRPLNIMSPAFAPLQRDPRFAQLRKRLGIQNR